MESTVRLDGQVVERIAELRLVVFDFDGVFTNNQVIVDQHGKESVVCNRSDGLALKLLREVGIEMLIISTEPNPVVSARARKLELECIQGCRDKGKALRTLLTERSLRPEQVAFVGNDINDSECLEMVGLPVAVGDAYPEATQRAKWILRATGGNGAIREFCHHVFELRKKER